jgi:hypothetical protein
MCDMTNQRKDTVFHFRDDKVLLDEAQSLAETEGTSLSTVIRRLMRNWVNEQRSAKMQTAHASVSSRKMTERRTGLKSSQLTYQCPKCGGYEVTAELHPMVRQRHNNEAHHVRLFLRCVRSSCGELSLTHYGSVDNSKRFVIRRFPRR